MVIACLVDFSRLAVYSAPLSLDTIKEHAGALIAIVASTLLGTLLGARYIEQITMRRIRLLIAALLTIIALGLGSGLL